MEKTKRNKRSWIIYVLLFLISFPLLYILGKNQREQDDLILKNGIETIGTVIDRSYGSNNSGRQFSVRFDFKVGEQTYTGHASFGNDRFYYDKAIVGMKYLVRYLPDEPNKFKNSRIYLEFPMIEEFNNIKTERRRILESYESGKKFIKHSRPISEVAPILGQ